MFKDITFPKSANYPTTHPQLRKIIYKVYGGECFYSGRKMKFEDMVIDHVHPASKGGVDNYYNYVPTVAKLNSLKSDKFSEEFCRRVYSLTHLTYCKKIDKLFYNYENPSPNSKTPTELQRRVALRRDRVRLRYGTFSQHRPVRWEYSGRSFFEILEDIDNGLVKLMPCKHGEVIMMPLDTRNTGDFKFGFRKFNPRGKLVRVRMFGDISGYIFHSKYPREYQKLNYRESSKVKSLISFWSNPDKWTKEEIAANNYYYNILYKRVEAIRKLHEESLMTRNELLALVTRNYVESLSIPEKEELLVQIKRANPRQAAFINSVDGGIGLVVLPDHVSELYTIFRKRWKMLRHWVNTEYVGWDTIFEN